MGFNLKLVSTLLISNAANSYSEGIGCLPSEVKANFHELVVHASWTHANEMASSKYHPDGRKDRRLFAEKAEECFQLAGDLDKTLLPGCHDLKQMAWHLGEYTAHHRFGSMSSSKKAHKKARRHRDQLNASAQLKKDLFNWAAHYAWYAANERKRYRSDAANSKKHALQYKEYVKTDSLKLVGVEFHEHRQKQIGNVRFQTEPRSTSELNDRQLPSTYTITNSVSKIQATSSGMTTKLCVNGQHQKTVAVSVNAGIEIEKVGSAGTSITATNQITVGYENCDEVSNGSSESNTNSDSQTVSVKCGGYKCCTSEKIKKTTTYEIPYTGTYEICGKRFLDDHSWLGKVVTLHYQNHEFDLNHPTCLAMKASTDPSTSATKKPQKSTYAACNSAWKNPCQQNGGSWTCGDRITYMHGKTSNIISSQNTVSNDCPNVCQMFSNARCAAFTELKLGITPAKRPNTNSDDCEKAWERPCEFKNASWKCGQRISYVYGKTRDLYHAKKLIIDTECPNYCAVLKSNKCNSFVQSRAG